MTAALLVVTVTQIALFSSTELSQSSPETVHDRTHPYCLLRIPAATAAVAAAAALRPSILNSVPSTTEATAPVRDSRLRLPHDALTHAMCEVKNFYRRYAQILDEIWQKVTDLNGIAANAATVTQNQSRSKFLMTHDVV